MNHCNRCNKDIGQPFCPECGSLAKALVHGPGEPVKGAPGQTFECVIWQGQMRGIKIGSPNRARFFSVRRSRIELVIDGEACLVELADNFWSTCTEIRVAMDRNGRNRLGDWIEKNGLLPPGESKRLRGKADTVVVEVLVPEERFGVRLSEGSGRNG